MKSLLRRIANYVLGFANFELIRKHSPDTLLKAANLATVIDGGANDGGFALHARSISSSAMIHSFEPLPWTYEKLTVRFSSDKRFKAYQLALSSENDNREFEINENQYSSSLLPMRADARSFGYGLGSTEKRIRVDITTLDTWAQEKDLPRPLLLKLDVEGNELAALVGAKEFLHRVDYVLTEINLIPLRDGQPTFHEMINFLDEQGFYLIDVYPGIMELRTGRAAWADVLFGRKASQKKAE